MGINNNMESKKITKAKESVEKARKKLGDKLSYKDYLLFSRYIQARTHLEYLESQELINRCYE